MLPSWTQRTSRMSARTFMAPPRTAIKIILFALPLMRGPPYSSSLPHVMTCGSDEEYGGPLIKGKANRMIFMAVLGGAMKVRADILEVRWVQDGSILHESLQSAPQSWLLPLLSQGSSKIPGYFI